MKFNIWTAIKNAPMIYGVVREIVRATKKNRCDKCQYWIRRGQHSSRGACEVLKRHLDVEIPNITSSYHYNIYTPNNFRCSYFKRK